MIKEKQTLKGLKSQLAKLEGEYSALKTEVGNRQREMSAKHVAIQVIKKEIKALEKPTDEIRVSEHALLRYFERVKGYDLEAIKAEIIGDEIRTMVETLGGSGQYPNPAGFAVVMKDFTVVTIL